MKDFIKHGKSFSHLFQQEYGYRIRPFLWIQLIFLLMAISLPFARAQVNGKHQTINPVIGDLSFQATFGFMPDESTDEDLRIQTHLAYVESRLRQKDVSCLSPEMQQKRAVLLDLLHDYWSAGKFPRNYDHMDVRKPCFIDKDNTICAVGYLVEQTSGRDVAEAINAKYKYAFVQEMNDDLVNGWIAESGLTKEECAMIQPDYGGYDPCNGNKVYACRYNDCVWECKCVPAQHVDQWIAHGKPCNPGNNGNGNGGVGPQGPAMSCICRINQGEVMASPHGAYTNPVSSSGEVSFYLDRQQNASIRLLDMSGRTIITIAQGEFEKGNHTVGWFADHVPPGIYFIQMETAGQADMERLIVSR